MTKYIHYSNKKGVDNMRKDMVTIGIIWAIAIIAGVFCYVYIGYSMASANRSGVCSAQVKCDPPISVPSSCPDGTYEVGRDKDTQAICKNNPTGCPYGDSISLGPECDKHKPADVKQIPNPVNVAEPVVNQSEPMVLDDNFVGK